MGIEAENTLAKQEAEESKPTENEIKMAHSYHRNGMMMTITPDRDRCLAKLFAAHRVETKRIVLEEQGIGNGQDLEKRHALSVRVTALEGTVKDLTHEKERLARALGYSVAGELLQLVSRLQLNSTVVDNAVQDSLRTQCAMLATQVSSLSQKLARYENIRKQLNEDPTLSVTSLELGDMPIGRGRPVFQQLHDEEDPLTP